MRIRIEGDGTPENTKIINTETNQEVPDVVGVQFAVTADKQPRVRITFELPVDNYILELPINI